MMMMLQRTLVGRLVSFVCSFYAHHTSCHPVSFVFDFKSDSTERGEYRNYTIFIGLLEPPPKSRTLPSKNKGEFGGYGF